MEPLMTVICPTSPRHNTPHNALSVRTFKTYMCWRHRRRCIKQRLSIPTLRQIICCSVSGMVLTDSTCIISVRSAPTIET
ncbi:hypothetical protein BS47DRAFT_507317 [Hydnum rufescens UP504]|uniref:Uncharacterized protein n=1 Tax=Hydnum rufescens UP504 TaxID=1448309 RepID=A0A9P6B4G8_9AGAM|nr:hypothetical protein BS47DRAFT_507317 [Hydnum rufescens UP504]